MPTETLRPNAAGTYQEWDLTNTSHWEATSDQSDSTYIYTNVDEERDIQNLADPTFGDGDTINWVQINFRAYASGSGQGEKAYNTYRVGGVDYQDVKHSLTRDSWNNYTGTQLTTYDGVNAWTKALVTALEAGARVDAVGGSEQIRISDIWVVVDYTVGGGTEHFQTVEDKAGLLDSVAKKHGVKKTVSDLTGLLDSVSTVKGITQTITDLTGLLDSVSLKQAFQKEASDIAGLTDSVAKVWTAYTAQSDIAGLVDSVSVVHTPADGDPPSAVGGGSSRPVFISSTRDVPHEFSPEEKATVEVIPQPPIEGMSLEEMLRYVAEFTQRRHEKEEEALEKLRELLRASLPNFWLRFKYGKERRTTLHGKSKEKPT